MPHIKPEEKEAHKFPAVFSVAGRTAHQMFLELKVPSLDFTLEARTYYMAVQAKLGLCEEWELLLAFILHADQISAPSNYITYENASPSPGHRQEAEKSLKNHPPNQKRSSGP